MANIFITGSADGLGAAAANRLISEGHDVVLHARNEKRASEALRSLPRARAVLVSDVSTLDGSFRLAELANQAGRFDAVIHNVGVFQGRDKELTRDGLAPTFVINTATPYILSAAMLRPARLVYLSSDMHVSGALDMSDLGWTRATWDATQAYCDSKLQCTMLAFGIARRWPDVLSNAIDPGWIATKMGGSSAPGDVHTGSATQAWLASSTDPSALVTGKYFHNKQQQNAAAIARIESVQDELFERLARLCGIHLTD